MIGGFKYVPELLTGLKSAVRGADALIPVLEKHGDELLHAFSSNTGEALDDWMKKAAASGDAALKAALENPHFVADLKSLAAERRLGTEFLTALDSGKPVDMPEMFQRHGVPISGPMGIACRELMDAKKLGTVEKQLAAHAEEIKGVKKEVAAGKSGFMNEWVLRRGRWAIYGAGLVGALALTEYYSGGAISKSIPSLITEIERRLREYGYEELAEKVKEHGLDALQTGSDISDIDRDAIINIGSGLLEEKGQHEAAAAFRIGAVATSPGYYLAVMGAEKGQRVETAIQELSKRASVDRAQIENYLVKHPTITGTLQEQFEIDLSSSFPGLKEKQARHTEEMKKAQATPTSDETLAHKTEAVVAQRLPQLEHAADTVKHRFESAATEVKDTAQTAAAGFLGFNMMKNFYDEFVKWIQELLTNLSDTLKSTFNGAADPAPQLARNSRPNQDALKNNPDYVSQGVRTDLKLGNNGFGLSDLVPEPG